MLFELGYSDSLKDLDGEDYDIFLAINNMYSKAYQEKAKKDAQKAKVKRGKRGR